jgi:hypothetical protein
MKQREGNTSQDKDAIRFQEFAVMMCELRQKLPWWWW